MRVEPLVPDVAPALPARPAEASPDAGLFARVLDDMGTTLERAQRAEDAFAAKRGSLHDAVYERARADIALDVATATAQRAAQAVQAILNMAV